MLCNEKCSYVPCLALKCDYRCLKVDRLQIIVVAKKYTYVSQPADTVPLIIIIRRRRSTERDSSCTLSRTHDRA